MQIILINYKKHDKKTLQFFTAKLTFVLYFLTQQNLNIFHLILIPSL